jgi:hypothetical protein
MDIKVEQRAIIKFLWHEGLAAEQIQLRLQAVYGDDVYALSSVYWWIRVFKTGRKYRVSHGVLASRPLTRMKQN